MSTNLPMTQEQIDEEQEFLALSGAHGLDAFAGQLKEAGIELPSRDIFKYVKRKHVEASMHATFRLMHGVQGMTYWASQNPTEFYQAWMKMANADSQLPNGAGGVQIIMPQGFAGSPLDMVELDKDGKVLNSVNFKDINGDSEL